LVDEQLRKRAVGAPGARSLLLTVLGEYVLPSGHGVWQETLVAALTHLGFSHQAARQAVARSARGGWLEAERRGRKARMRLSDSTRALVQTGADRIYTFGAPHEWDGRWLVVVLRVAEENRAVRHQLRSSLAWAGLGSLGGGLWLTPHVDREREITPILQREPLAGAISLIAEFGALGQPEQVVASAWDLDEVRAQYDSFISGFSRVRPVSPVACFREQTLLVHAWRKFPFLDPDFPNALLPPNWPRERAHALFVDRHERWAPAAQGFFRELEDSAAPATRNAA
jgi:phenylacetic acid degradation operon negative regulatory protein